MCREVFNILKCREGADGRLVVVVVVVVGGGVYMMRVNDAPHVYLRRTVLQVRHLAAEGIADAQATRHVTHTSRGTHHDTKGNPMHLHLHLHMYV